MSHSPATPPAEGAVPEFFSRQVLKTRRFVTRGGVERRGVNVACGGWERCAPDFCIDRQGFPYYSVEFVAEGLGELVLAGNEYDLAPGAAFVYGPEDAHLIKSDSDRPMLKYFVDFSGRRASVLFAECDLRVPSIARVGDLDRVRRLFDELITAGLAPGALAAPICMSLLEVLLLTIKSTAVPYTAGMSASYATYERCRRHIDEHFVALLSVEQAAEACGVDPAYLCRLFRRFTEQSPYQYLLHLKMSRAADLLQTPGRLVKEVAAELGFADPFHFSRAFKRVLGISPSEMAALRSTRIRAD